MRPDLLARNPAITDENTKPSRRLPLGPRITATVIENFVETLVEGHVLTTLLIGVDQSEVARAREL